MSNPFRFDIVMAKLKQAKSDLPIILAKQTENYWVDNFKREQWDGKPWQVPQRRIAGSKAYRWPKSKGLTRRTKRTLIGTGALRRAVSVSARSKSFERIVFQVDLPYASIHNEGGTMANGGKMPKRQYMGDNKELRAKQVQTITKEINKIWR